MRQALPPSVLPGPLPPPPPPDAHTPLCILYLVCLGSQQYPVRVAQCAAARDEVKKSHPEVELLRDATPEQVDEVPCALCWAMFGDAVLCFWLCKLKPLLIKRVKCRALSVGGHGWH